MFEFSQLSQAVYDTNRKLTHYRYINGEALHILSEKLNFTPIYGHFSENLVGYQLPNGSFSGFFGISEVFLFNSLSNKPIFAFPFY